MVKRNVIKYCCDKRNCCIVWVAVISFYLGSWTTMSLIPIDGISSSKSTQEISNDAYEHVEYVVFILSAPKHQIQRDSIRSTWGRLVNNAAVANGKKVFTWNQSNIPANKISFIKLYFVIGTYNMHSDVLNMITSEKNKNEDLVFLNNVEDKYENLAVKVLNGIQYFNDNFKNLKYLIKCDDDSFIRIDLLVQEIEMFAPSMNAQEISKYVTYKDHNSEYNELYWGYFNGKARIFTQGKWKEKDWFLSDKYLPYALGGGYILSKSIVNYIALNHEILSCYNSEDVSMGVWTAALAKINRVHDIRFDTEWTTRGCSNYMLVRQKQKPEHMLEMYQSLVNSNGNILCSTEFINRKPYFYNWNVPPSNCCTIVK